MNKLILAALGLQAIAVGLKLVNVITESWAITFFPAYFAIAFFGATWLQKKIKG